MLIPVQSGRPSLWTQPSPWWYRPGPTPSARSVRAVKLRDLQSDSLHCCEVLVCFNAPTTLRVSSNDWGGHQLSACKESNGPLEESLWACLPSGGECWTLSGRCPHCLQGESQWSRSRTDWKHCVLLSFYPVSTYCHFAFTSSQSLSDMLLPLSCFYSLWTLPGHLVDVKHSK